MLAQQSAIKLKHFAILQSHYEFQQQKGNLRNVNKLFSSYEVDIEFAHHDDKEENVFEVFVKIGINNAKKRLPGYKLLVEGMGVFKIEDPDLSQEDFSNLKYYSSVSILIGYLRNSLTSLTASAPLGPYLLPPIDMPDLFAKKSDNNEEPEE